jgi:dihydroorotate dehydrogenase
MNGYALLRPLIYCLTPDQAHATTLALLRLGGATPPGRWLLSAWFRPRHTPRPVRVFGIDFANPIGLAAGYDKDGLGWRGLACLGFGHLELGTVTPRPQPGNPTPRVFRLVPDEAVINRMGFPGRGADFMARRLHGARPKGLVLGVNIGKNKVTPLEEAPTDYLSLFYTLAPWVDYLAVNVSSPNTPGLRSLQTRQALEDLLAPLAKARDGVSENFRNVPPPVGGDLRVAPGRTYRCAPTTEIPEDPRAAHPRYVPLLVKLAPDLSNAELDGALEAILGCGMDGVIQGNTTIQRPNLHSPFRSETGGLSGRPLDAIAQAALQRTIARLAGRLPVIASGGVLDPAGARARLDAGAALVQLYTGLIYRGPGLVREILDDLALS